VATPTLERHNGTLKSLAGRRSLGPIRKSMGAASATGRSRIHASCSHHEASAVTVRGQGGGKGLPQVTQQRPIPGALGLACIEIDFHRANAREG
jgi:hypothetical protein